MRQKTFARTWANAVYYETEETTMKKEEKSTGKALQETLSYKKKNYYETASDAERKAMYAYAEGYKAVYVRRRAQAGR